MLADDRINLKAPIAGLLAQRKSVANRMATTITPEYTSVFLAQSNLKDGN